MAKILIVEDNPIDMTATENILADTGHTLIKATDGEQGLAKAASESPDLIVLDIILPGLNGFQVCRSLKSDAKTEKIKVIMLTTKDQDSDKFWGMKQGADEYITKPVDGEKLLQLVKKFL